MEFFSRAMRVYFSRRSALVSLGLEVDGDDDDDVVFFEADFAILLRMVLLV